MHFDPSEAASQPMFDNWVENPYMTTEINGLVTPLSHPLMDEPQIQELISPLEELSAHDLGTQYAPQIVGDTNSYWFPPATQKMIPNLVMNGYQPVHVSPYEMWSGQPIVHDVDTAPTSPNFLPIETMGEDTNLSRLQTSGLESEGEELIAMGLYDSPAEVQAFSDRFRTEQGISGSTGRKSLKLEDAFEPASENDSLSQAGSRAEFEASSPTDFPTLNTDYPGSGPNLSDQSFYLENDLENFAVPPYTAASLVDMPSNNWQYPVYGWI